jgi:PPM family protein phosphatase
MKLESAGLTDPGLVRKNNEDCYWVDGDLGLLVVADGMGGHAAGEVASQMAVDTIRQQVAQGLKTGQIPAVGQKPIHLSDRAHLLTAAVHMANEMVFTAADRRPDRKGMGTTVVSVLVGSTSFAVAHVGDSRAYLYRGGKLKQITRDHSLVAEQVAKGLMTEEQAEASDIKNVLTRAVGIGPQVEVDADEYPLKPEDVLILCSDGLCRMAPDGEIAAALSGLNNPSEMCHNLVRLAVDRGGRDNVTVIVGKMQRSGLLERIAGKFPGRANGKG